VVTPVLGSVLYIMHIMTAREARQHFGELMDRAMRGESVGITRNGRLVVVVEAAATRPADPAAPGRRGSRPGTDAPWPPAR
jgi:prevent-host-death family protein